MQSAKNEATGFQAEANLGGFAPQVNNLAQIPEQLQHEDLQNAGQQRRDLARTNLHNWFAARSWAANKTNDPDIAQGFHQQNSTEPFPQEELRYLEPGEAHVYRSKLQNEFAGPAMQGAQAVKPGSNIGANLSAKAASSYAGLAPLVARGKVGLGTVAHDVLGVDNTDFMDQARKEMRQAEGVAERARTEQQFIAQQLPQTPAAEFVTGQADLAIKMGTAAVATALTRNPKVGTAMFTGLFGADAAGSAYQSARQSGRNDDEAQQDAVFSGIKAGIIAQLPMAWPALARETAAVQMAGAYLSGTAITTGDAAADEAWKALVRGEKVDQSTLERIGTAMLQGGAPAALLHGAHVMRAGDVPARGAEPRLTRPDTMQTPGVDEAQAYNPQPTKEFPPVNVDTTPRGKDALQIRPDEAGGGNIDLLAPAPVATERPQEVPPPTPPTATEAPPAPPNTVPIDSLPGPKGQVTRTPRDIQTPQGEAARQQVTDLLTPQSEVSKESPHAPTVDAAQETAPANAPRAPEAVDRTVGQSSGNSGDVKKQPWEMTQDEFANDIPAAELPPGTERIPGKQKAMRSPDGTIWLPNSWDSQFHRAIDLGDHAKAIEQLKAAGWDIPTTTKGVFSDAHHVAVRQALAEGKPVPPEVLAEYPDLARQSNAGAPSPDAATGIAKGANVQQEAGQRGENVGEAPKEPVSVGSAEADNAPAVAPPKEPTTPVVKSKPKLSDPLVPRLRKQAETLARQVEEKRRPMTQNATPKRQREYDQRRMEGNFLERLQKSMVAIADARESGTLPKSLEGVKTKDQIGDLIRQKTKSAGGYYDAHFETGEFQDTSPAGKALQEMINPRSPEQKQRAAEAERESNLRELERKVQFRDIPGYFPTPKPLVDRMIDAADVQPGDKVLEPSAGKGDIADAVAKITGKENVDTYEVNRDLADILAAKGFRPGGEFISSPPEPQYDKIVMNPPFEKGQDQEHVRHAFEQLKPGGKLVAIMSEGSFSRSGKRDVEFQDWLKGVGGLSEKVESGAFQGKDSARQTGVATRLVEIRKPEKSNGEPAPQSDKTAKPPLSIEPHGQGLRIIRAGPEMTALGENWEGKKLGTYNKKAGGWIFNPKNEGEIQPVLDKINAARGAGTEAGKASDETPKTTFAPTAAEGAPRPQVPRGKRGGFIALPDFKGMLGDVRHVRERYSAIEAHDSAELASGLTQHVQAGHTAETIIRNFERKAFEGAPDKEKAIEEFRAIGWNNRATLAKAKGLPATQIPTLTAAQEAAIRAKPYIRKAIDLWNDEIAPAIQNIRTRSRLPMDPNAGNVDLFLNLPSEGSAAGGGESGVNLTPAFAKPMIGEGDYKLDPHDTLVSIVRGHLATDASRDIAAAIRNRVSINPANVVDPLAKRNPLTFQQPKAGSYFQAQYKGRTTDVAVVDLNTNPMKAPELHYVPKRVAEAMDQARQSTDPHDTPIDKLMHGATRMGLIGDFAPHTLRVLFQAASRVGQSGQSAASAVPWIGSIPATIVRMAKMAKSPLAETMQLLIDKGGASRGSGYNLAEPTSRIAKLADVSHKVLMDPETGIDPRARRVVADAHLRMELGNKFMDGLEKEIDAGTTTPADAADQIHQQLGGAGMQALGRRVNATLGFSTKQTRGNIINNLQRWLPFLSSESGMIPDEIRKLLTLNLNPRAIAKNLGRGEYGSAALQVATQLATGAIGTMLARQALNYAFSGHAMDQNDEGRKLDVQIAKGWYLGNLDPTFDRAARLLGLRDRANHKEAHPGREAVNELFATMNPALRMAFSASTDATPYIQDDRHLMAARAGWWWPTGFMRNTVQSIGEGKGAARGVAQDLTSFLTGLRLTPSSGKNYSDAERTAHDLAGKHAQELTPEERAKHDARHDLISQLREKPENRGTLVQSAIKAGTIERSEASSVIRDSQRDDFQNTVRRLELPDAVKVWEKASTAERVKLRTIMYQKVRDSRDVEQRKRALAALRAEDSK